VTGRRRRESWAAVLAAALTWAGAPRLAAADAGAPEKRAGHTARTAAAGGPGPSGATAGGVRSNGAPGGGPRASGAAAGGPGAAASSVAVLRPVAGDAVLQEASVRIRSELDAAGTPNLLVDCPGSGPSEWRACTNSSSAAWISLGREDGIATLQVMATLSDGLELRRHVRVPPEAGGNDPSVLAVRAVELLRDIYLDIPRVAARSPTSGGAAATVESAVAAPAPSRIAGRAFVGASVLQGRRGLGAVPGPVFGFGVSFASRLTLLASVAGPFQETVGSAAVGRADTWQTLATLTLRYELGSMLVRPYAAAGVGVYSMRVQSDSPSGPPVAVGLAPSVLAPLIAVGVGVIAHVLPWLAITLDLEEAAILPTQDVTTQDAMSGTTLVGRAGPSDLVQLGLVLCAP
jgi:hypothetical protein